MKNFTLNNGQSIPSIGLGTWKCNGNEAIETVKFALENGYKHIDTAAMYLNEKEIGVAIKDSEVAREELFITSKLLPQERGYETTFKAFEKTINDLGVDYLDLYLIHWPANAKSNEDWKSVNRQTWKAFEELYKAGKIRSIGISNFLPHHLEALLEDANVTPSVNQIEHHPGYVQKDAIGCCKKYDILVEAWSPLGRGAVLHNEKIISIAKNYQKSPGQICIKWRLQNGVCPLPKLVTAERIKENIDVFDFTIDAEDMASIDNLPLLGFSGYHPDEMVFG